LPKNALAVEAISFIERLAENPPLCIRRTVRRRILRLVLLPLPLPPVSGGEVGAKDDVVGDDAVEYDVVGVSGFFLKTFVMDSQKPPFIVLFFLCRIYIII